HARCRGRVQLSLAPGRRGAHRGVACCAAEGTTWHSQVSRHWQAPGGSAPASSGSIPSETRRASTTARTISDGSVRYTWSHEGTPHEGVFTLRGGRASWSDSWHQPTAVECSELPEVPGLLALHP